MVVNMRDFIEQELNAKNLGSLVKVKGPDRGNGGDADWFEIAIFYRPPGTETHKDAQFFEKRIDVCIGYKNKGGYWNRRQIRVAIEKEALTRMTDEKVAAVWTSAQRALTAGPIEL